MTGKADALRSNQPSRRRAPELIRGASVKQKGVETKPKRVTRSRRASAADEHELGLVAAK
jgi:hypothetical protein